MKHLAVIADGNRRWAAAAGLSKKAGYLRGLTVIEECCEWAVARDVSCMTFYCFSTENWGRSKIEVDMLMQLGRQYFAAHAGWYADRNIKVLFSGRRDRLPKDLVDSMTRMEEVTEGGSALTIVFCIDYGGRDEIVRAIASGARTEEEINMALSVQAPMPDAILRTGGQMRLSNFMLWQAAYAELFFTDSYFPELNANLLDSILGAYEERKRSYGK